MRLAALLVLVSGCDKLFLAENALPPPDASMLSDPDLDAALPCPPAFTGQHLALSSQRPWRMAQRDCENLHVPGTKYSYLVVISDETERQTVKAMHGGEDKWIGLTDLEVEEDFRWINGERVPIVWELGQPDNDGQTCGRLSMDGVRDTDCTDTWLAVCECSHIGLERYLFD